MGLTQRDIKRLSPAAQRQIRNAGKNQREPKTQPRKYKNTPCDYVFEDGTVEHFDSVKERNRFAELILQQRAGIITDLKRQVEYQLIPANKRGDGKTERACKYIADFVYMDAVTGDQIVEDVKGYRDPNSAGYAKFVIKRKLMLDRYGITVKEI